MATNSTSSTGTTSSTPPFTPAPTPAPAESPATSAVSTAVAAAAAPVFSSMAASPPTQTSDELIDAPVPFTETEKVSASIKNSCKLTAMCLDSLVRSVNSIISSENRNQTLRCWLLKIFFPDKDVAKKAHESLKALKRDDKEGFKKVISALPIDFTKLKTIHGEQAVKVLQLLLNSNELMDRSLRDIAFMAYSDNPLMKTLETYGALPGCTLHDTFLEMFLSWVLELEGLTEAEEDALMALFHKMAGGKSTTAEEWLALKRVPDWQKRLNEFKTFPIFFLSKVLDISGAKPPHMQPKQIAKSYALFSRYFTKLCQEQNDAARNLEAYTLGLLDLSYAKASQSKGNKSKGAFVIIDRKKFDRQARNQIQPEGEREFIRKCEFIENSWKQKKAVLDNEMALLRRVPEQAEFAEWNLIVKLEPLYSQLEEMSRMIHAFQIGCATGVLSTQSEQERMTLRLAQRRWTEMIGQIAQLLRYSRTLERMMRRDVEARFFPHSELERQEKEKDSKGQAVSVNSSLLVLSKEVLRRISYERLRLYDNLEELETVLATVSKQEKPPSPPPEEHKEKLVKSTAPMSTSEAMAIEAAARARALAPTATTATATTAVAAPATPTTKLEPESTALNAQLEADLRLYEGQVAPSPYGATLAKQLSKSLTATHGASHPEAPRLISEVTDHLFLVTQGLELLLQTVAKNRADLLVPIFRGWLMDISVMVEQRLTLEVLTKKRPMHRDHDMERLATDSGMVFSHKQKAFLQEFHHALIWTRYPASAMCYVDPKNQPASLAILETLLKKGIGSKEDLNKVVGHMLTATMTAFSIILPPSIGTGKAHKAFEALTEKLQKTLAATAFTPAKPAPSSATAYEKARGALEKEMNKCAKVKQLLEGNPMIHLQEVVYYLVSLEQSSKLQQLFPQEALHFWHLRNSLEMEKLFKHLFEAHAVLNQAGPLWRHDFQAFETALKGSIDIQKDMPLLRSINVMIAHHYHTRSSNLGPVYRKLVTDAQEVSHGFQAAKAKGLPDFDLVFKLFESYYPKTLKKLKETEASCG